MRGWDIRNPKIGAGGARERVLAHDGFVNDRGIVARGGLSLHAL